MSSIINSITIHLTYFDIDIELNYTVANRSDRPKFARAKTQTEA